MIKLSDTELLERAALAANVGGEVYQEFGRTYGILLPKGMSHFDNQYWNPLKDDGDLYRLIKKLELNLNFSECRVWKTMPDGTEFQAFWNPDSNISEAYAIVQVAADIGVSMYISHNSLEP